jgi:lipopolysaccharide/colanic/teichoic acid biosynthesis glycosyltransferase
MSTTELAARTQRERSTSSGAVSCEGDRLLPRDTPTEIRPRRPAYLLLKLVVEYAAAAVLLLAALPVIAVAGLLVKLTSRGPMFYVQIRVGKRGRRFRLMKLRTMVDNAEADTGPVWAGRNDPRVTPVGRILRATHIDEFPQLINVLLGQMALIGPRPERPEFVEDLREKIACYDQRLNVKPGITGLAQLILPPDTDFSSVRRKLVHDLYYVRFLGPWLDLRIFLVTLWLLLKAVVSCAWSCISLPTTDDVCDRVERFGIAAETLSTVDVVRK